MSCCGMPAMSGSSCGAPMMMESSGCCPPMQSGCCGGSSQMMPMSQDSSRDSELSGVVPLLARLAKRRSRRAN